MGLSGSGDSSAVSSLSGGNSTLSLTPEKFMLVSDGMSFRKMVCGNRITLTI